MRPDDPRDPGWGRWPGYIPYPTEIPRWDGDYSVPNEMAIHWPQAQLAPAYLPAGSPSFQPYRYEQGGPLKGLQPQFEFSTPSPSVFGDAMGGAFLGDPEDMVDMAIDEAEAELSEAEAEVEAAEGMPLWKKAGLAAVAAGALYMLASHYNPRSYDVRSNPAKKLGRFAGTAMEKSIRGASKKDLPEYVEWLEAEVKRWKGSPTGMHEFRSSQMKIARDEAERRCLEAG